MRKLGLLAAAAGVVLGGTFAKADFIVTSSRQANAFTLNSLSYDIVTYSVTNDGNNSTGTKMSQVDVALFAPAHGLVIGVDTTNHPDVYNLANPATANYSFINGNLANSNTAPGESVLVRTGPATFTVDQANGADAFSGVYTNQMSVAGIAGDLFWTTAAKSPTITSAFAFAQVAVQSGDPTYLLAPGAANRTAAGNVPASWEQLATQFGIVGGSTVPIIANVVNATPEPASLGFFGFAAAGLLARRRRAL